MPGRFELKPTLAKIWHAPDNFRIMDPLPPMHRRGIIIAAIVLVVFQVDAAPGAATGGVKVADVIESQAPDKLVYEPGNPLADANGYVKMPNVDVVGEMVNTMSASRSYQANVEVLNTVKSMMLKTLTLGQ